MLESKVRVVNRLGLHARAAAQLVRLAGKFKSRITLERADNNVACDAKSILSVLSLAAAQGTELDLIIEGKDKQKALASIEELFRSGFGEL